MHANVHFAVGVIIASVSNYILSNINGFLQNLIEFGIIIIFALGADFDILFVSLLKNIDEDRGHRFFITHSIYPFVAILIFGISLAISLSYHIIWICSLVYLSHLMLDCIDGGINLFYTERIYGLFLLTRKEKHLFLGIKRALDKEREKNPYFMDLRYFNNPIILCMEILISVAGLISLLVFAISYWYVYFGYFLLLAYHLNFYFKGKTFEELILN